MPRTTTTAAGKQVDIIDEESRVDLLAMRKTQRYLAMEHTEPNPSEAIEPLPGSVSPFQDLEAPEPTDPTPPVLARWLGFAAVAISGLLGGLIGYGTGDLLGTTQIWPLGGMVFGAATAAIGVGVVVNLTLQAMNEWDTTSHPEARKSASN